MAGSNNGKFKLSDHLSVWRNKLNGLSQFVGDSDSILTTEDSDLVGAINEIEGVFDASANKINTTGDFTVDIAAGDIILDAGAADVILKDDGTQYGTLTNSSGNLIIKSGSTTNLTMSGANVTSAGSVTVTNDLTVNGNTTLGNAATDTVTITADVASDIIPSVDGTYDLGAVGSEWQDLFIDGTAQIDSLVADTADINAGTIDNTVIGASTPAAATFTTATANTSVTTPLVVATGDLSVDVVGDITLDADGSDIIFSDAAAERFRFNLDAGPSIEITGDATIFGSGNVTIDAGTDITLDVDGADVFLKDAGVQFGAFTNNSANLIVKSGSTTNLTMSGANVTSAGTITATTAVNTDTINEKTSLAGVTIDSVLLKDNTVKTGTLTVAAASITDTSGSISFGNENLTTTGNINGANGTFTGNLTVSGSASIIGNASTDSVAIEAQIGSHLIPSGDAEYDLGSVSKEWNNLYIDGTANIDALVADTADINGGTIDGTVIGGTSAAAGSFTTVNASSTIQGTTITATTGLVAPQLTRTGDFTLDVSGDINLDAGGADIILKDDGSTYGGLTNSSGNLIVKSGTTTNLTMSGANVTSAGSVTATTSVITPLISRTGDLTLDASGDIILDADGANIVLKDAGTIYGSLDNNAGELRIRSGTNKNASGDIVVNFLDSDMYVLGDIYPANLSSGFTDSGYNTVASALNLLLSNYELLDSDVIANADAFNSQIGSLGSLVTTNKSNIVSAINEVHNHKLSDFSATTSAELKTVISDETGSGALVFGTSPTIVTPTVTTSIGTGSTTFSLVNTTATTVNVAGAATTLNLGAATGTTTVKNNLTVDGNLTVSGTTTTVNSNTVNIGDNIIRLNADETGVPSQNAGIEVERGTSKNKSIQWNEAVDQWYIESDYSGTLRATSFIGALTGNATTATTLATGRTIALSGDVTATGVSFDGSGNISLATTIAANSVALGTDTTGNYVGTITAGTGISSTGATTGEGIAHTLSLTSGVVTPTTATNGISAITVDTYGRVTSVTGSAGYGTSTATVTSVGITAGTGIVSSGTNPITTSGTIELAIDLNELATSTTNGDGDYFVVVDTAGVERKLTKANINLSEFNNNSGWTSNTGTVTSVGITAGTGLSGGGTVTSSGTISLATALSELTDMTDTMLGTDEFIVLDASADRRKAANEIGLSIFSNDAGFTTNTGTVTSHTVSAGSGLTGGGTVTTSGTTTLNVGAGTGISVSADAVALATAGAGAATYSSGISTITIDAYGRVTSVTGSAGYTTAVGDITGVAVSGSGLSGGGTSGSVTITSNATTAATANTIAYRDASANIYANDFYATSDMRLKTDVAVIENPLNKLAYLDGFNYRWNELATNPDKETVQVGVSAQQVEGLFPHIVNTNEDGYKTVAYDKLVPLLIEAVKELHEKVKLLEGN